MTYKNMLIVKSLYAEQAKFAIGTKWSTDSVIPRMFGEIYYPTLKGDIDGWIFTALKLKILIEIEIDPSSYPGPLPGNDPSDVKYQPYTPPATAPDLDWRIAPAVIATVAIGTATIIEDFVTLGAGIADDPACFALMAFIMAWGMGELDTPVVPESNPILLSPGRMSL